MKNQAPVLASDEAERGVLGRLIVDDRHFYEFSSRLKEEDFADPRNGDIYGAIRRLVERGVVVTRPSLIAEIPGNDVEIPAYISALVAGAAKADQLSSLINIIAGYAAKRSIINVAEEIKLQATGAGPSVSTDDIRSLAISKLEGISDSSVNEGHKLGAVIQRVIDNAGQIIKSGKPIGIKCGLQAFDDLIGSILPGQMIVVAGETGAGKTSLATQIAYLAASTAIPVWLTSLEMQEDEISARILGAQGNISATAILEGKLTEEELDWLFENVGIKLNDLPIWFDDSPGQSPATIQARLARAKIKHGVKLGVIDHLQFIEGTNNKSSRTERIEDNVNSIKATAKRLKLPIILVSHVSRQIDWRQMHTANDISRPVISDLYGSSAIEKAADGIIFVHRPSWFLRQLTPPEHKRDQWAKDLIFWDGKAELVMPKRRGGTGFGVRRCRFDENRTWFEDEREEEKENGFVPEKVGGFDYGAVAEDGGYPS